MGYIADAHRLVGLLSPFAGGGESWVPLAMGVAPLAFAVLTLAVYVPSALRRHVLVSFVVSLLAFALTRWLIPVISLKIPEQKRGCDLLKRPIRAKIELADKTVPESMGVVSGVSLVLALVVTQAMTTTPHEYSAAMLSIVFAVLLGFVDDFLDLEWKYKYVLPPLMSLPLLSAYDGGTRVVPPRFCRAALVDQAPLGRLVDTVTGLLGGEVDYYSGAVDLGLIYKVYMVLLAVFCTNAINIYAGVNGLEAGQTYVVACAVLVMSAIELSRENDDSTKNHLFAVTLMLPFATTTLALLRSNWFPAQVFVGDTFTNYAGMTLAVCAILGHFPIMLMLLMLPQLFNFLLSVPQLFGLRPCPRHRLPSYDETSGLVRASRLNDRKDIVPDEKDRLNLTLINAALVVFGPLTEPALVTILLFFQAACCLFGIALRFALVGQVY